MPMPRSTALDLSRDQRRLDVPRLHTKDFAFLGDVFAEARQTAELSGLDTSALTLAIELLGTRYLEAYPTYGVVIAAALTSNYATDD